VAKALADHLRIFAKQREGGAIVDQVLGLEAR